MADYIPGACNIDASGQKKRLVFGVVGILLGLIIGVLIALKILSIWWMVLSFVFFWGAMLGIVQSRSKFCVANASKSQYEVKGKMTRIEDNESKLLDMKKARKIHMQAIIYAIILTAIFTAFLAWLS